MIDYYEILEVSPNASQEIIKAAYKTLLHRYNLEHDSEDQSDVEKLHRLNLAYDVLSDPDKRESYNQNLKKARNLRNQSGHFQDAYESTVENTAKFSPAGSNPATGHNQDLDKTSILSLLKWNKWGWSISIFAVAAVLISMVQPDPEKALKGQEAVKSHVERKELDTGVQNIVEKNQQGSSVEEKVKEEVVK